MVGKGPGDLGPDHPRGAWNGTGAVGRLSQRFDPSAPRMGTVLYFEWEDDETCRVTLHNEQVILMEHGPHGWDGMVGIRDALLAVARVQGWRVEVIGEPGI